jgi:SagB-type dehydrogenase family enzyme
VAERYRRSPYLVCYWERRRLVFENFEAHTRYVANPLAVTILHHFDRWRPPTILLELFPTVDDRLLARTVATLVRLRLLERSGGPESARQKALARWRRWMPAAAFFHFSTKDGHVRDHREHLRRQAGGSAAARGPAVKRYRDRRSEPLPLPSRGGSFPEILLRRRTWRRFSRAPLAKAQLATLLGLTFGVQSWSQIPGFGRVALKTSPSGGAQHPIEAYVLAPRVAGVRPGLYHYDAGRHRLDLLRRGAARAEIFKFLNGQTYFCGAAAVVLLTAVFARTQWKYPASRAYRTVLIEAGHLCQTFCLVATWLGLAPFCTMALSESAIERALGIDGVGESVLYTAGVGVPPADAARVLSAGPEGRRIPNRALGGKRAR